MASGGQVHLTSVFPVSRNLAALRRFASALSLMAVMLFFLAAEFLVLGQIGEYVGRLYLETKHRPLFIVQDVAVSSRHCTASAGACMEIYDERGVERQPIA